MTLALSDASALSRPQLLHSSTYRHGTTRGGQLRFDSVATRWGIENFGAVQSSDAFKCRAITRLPSIPHFERDNAFLAMGNPDIEDRAQADQQAE